MLAKINALITAIDDIYDVYGTLEELQLFTDAIRRWDIESIDKLPIYMKVCYLALYNFVNEMAYYTLKDKAFNSIPFLRKAWVDLVEAYLIEANWYHKGYKPSLEEYINNAWITVGGIPVLSHLFFRLTNSIHEEAAESVHKYHDIVRASCTITRLADDMGTSLAEVERGDVPKSVQCYMNENNASEEEARKHVRSLIKQTWKTMNKEMIDPPFSTCFVEVCANLARMAQLIYQKESDGFGMQHSYVNKQLRRLLFEPYE
ncbi:1,8-cineole synthase, chloroplastic [Salvia divinorum]|uniref:1,8-cineole synthase, chloroplastic n=2 Tax=Salvia divinorum TaxID=28513 RepID=A0ABD1FRD7_SALDI